MMLRLSTRSNRSFGEGSHRRGGVKRDISVVYAPPQSKIMSPLLLFKNSTKMQHDHYLKTVSWEKLIPFLVFDSVFSEDGWGDFMIDLSGAALGDGNGETSVSLGIKSTVPHLRPRSAAMLGDPTSSSLVVMFAVVLPSSSAWSTPSNSESTSSSINLTSCRTSRTGTVEPWSSPVHREPNEWVWNSSERGSSSSLKSSCRETVCSPVWSGAEPSPMSNVKPLLGAEIWPAAPSKPLLSAVRDLRTSSSLTSKSPTAVDVVVAGSLSS